MTMNARALFSPPDASLRQGLRTLHTVLDHILPQTRSQKADLPKAVRDLSARLTTERGGLSRPYWISPRLTAAYLHYFLPWNLVRLTGLLPGLPLYPPQSPARTAGQIPSQAAGLPDQGRSPDAPGTSGSPGTPGTVGSPGSPERPVMLDLGSGPLTLPLALWLSRPDLRALPLRVVASDTSPHILNLGMELFHAVKERLDPSSPWDIQTLRAPLSSALRLSGIRPWLLSAGNVLNEWEKGGPSGAGRQDESRLHALLEQTAAGMRPGGLVLALEPGNRLGGKVIARLRESALRQGFLPLAPCPHDGRCPLAAQNARSWCHFNAGAEAAPEALRELSRRAGLDKDSVSLSFVLLAAPDQSGAGPPGPPSQLRPAQQRRQEGQGRDKRGGPLTLTRETPGSLPARLISDPFPLPGHAGRARYACTSRGLALIPASAPLPSGALVQASPCPERDAKSGAILMRLPPALPDPAKEAPRAAKKTGEFIDRARRRHYP